MTANPTTWQAAAAAGAGQLPTSSASSSTGATLTSSAGGILHPLWRGAAEVALVVAGLVLVVAGGARIGGRSQP